LTFLTGGSVSNLGHALEYRFDWGDGEFSDWSSSLSADHSWSADDVYEIKAQARCKTHTSVVSAWSESTLVAIGDIASPYPPLPPSDLDAADDGGVIVLTWQDNSNNELGFIIERKSRSLGYFHEVGTSDKEETTYIDTAVRQGEKYWYRVRAFNYTEGAGGGPVFTISAPSNEDTAWIASGGGCFIASSAFGSFVEPGVQTLRDFRDGYLSRDSAGRLFTSTYYKYSPAIAGFVDDHPDVKPIIRGALVPAIGISNVALHTTFVQKLLIGLSAFVILFAVLVIAKKRACIY
jgi:hypothetical protein